MQEMLHFSLAKKKKEVLHFFARKTGNVKFPEKLIMCRYANMEQTKLKRLQLICR